jgi:hypothetical protein
MVQAGQRQPSWVKTRVVKGLCHPLSNGRPAFGRHGFVFRCPEEV